MNEFLTWSRHMRVIATAGATVVAVTIAGAQAGDHAEIDKSTPPAHWKLPAAKMLSVEESLASFELPAGFRIELVAAEPLVQDPVAIYFDEAGRLWVIEWPGYNWPLRRMIPGVNPLELPKALVAVVEDSDRDGKMDRRTVFLESYDWPRGLQLVRGGALVLKMPYLVMAHDADSDGRAERETFLESALEVPTNPHGAPSNLFRSMDNWIYGGRFSYRLRQVDGAWRREPAVNPKAQWGISQDNYGRMVYSSNTDHLRGDLVPPHYFARNPNSTAVAGIEVRFPADQKTWPSAATPGTNRRGHLREEDGSLAVFTSNTAPTVYRGDQFPAEYVDNVFLGEVAGRFIRRSVRTEKDGEITARNAYELKEFSFSHDERFRPVYTANGPDGALYVADMHRGIIEGDIFMTSFLRNQVIARKLQEPFHGLGRVYRIVHTGRPAQTPPVLSRQDVAGWVERLAHANGFWRDTAQRVLVEMQNRQAVAAVRKLAREHSSELARLHALWTLEGLNALEPALIVHALGDRSPKIRVAALRLSEPMLTDRAVQAKVIALQTDPEVEVRRQLIFTLGEGKGAAFDDAMLATLRKDITRPVFLEAALTGLRGREFQFLQRVLRDAGFPTERKETQRLYELLAQAAVNGGNMADLEGLVGQVADSARPLLARQTILEAMIDQKKRVPQLPANFAKLETSREDAVRKRAGALKKVWTAPPAVVRDIAGEFLERGEKVYALCGACHGPEGRGQTNIAPPLDGSLVVSGSADDLLKSILLGRNLDRQNKAFPDMPSLAALPDEDIAAVASYVRAKWGLPGMRQIIPGRVKQLRTEVVIAPAR